MKLSIAPNLLAVLVATVATKKLNFAFAQIAPECTSSMEYAYDSGETSAATTTVTIQSTPWLQLDFTGTELAKNAKLFLRGSKTSQEIDADALAANSYSAVFDGNSVAVELSTPGSLFRGSSNGNTSQVKISSVNVGLCAPPKVAPSICGDTDDRILSYDVRQGRMGGCTAWLIAKNVFVWAGHCGTPSSSTRLHFVYDGSSAATEDQYAVEVLTYRGVDGGVGNDWGAGRLKQTNGRWPGEAQRLKCTGTSPQTEGCDHCRGTNSGKECGWYNLGTVPGSTSGQNIIITGYGTAATQSRWQKTHEGALASTTSTRLSYVPDTTGGNSGSPVEHKETGNAIGVHTHGGCSSTGGSNSGTRIDVPAFAAHVEFLTKTCANDGECSDGNASNGIETCDANNQCQFGVAPTPAPTPYSNPCGAGETDVRIKVLTDNYASETTWTLENMCDSTMLQNMPGTISQYSNAVMNEHQWCMPEAQQYKFTINDSYGDGICCGYGEGEYSVWQDGVMKKQGGQYANTDSVTFGTCSGTSSPSKSPTPKPTASPVIPTPEPSKAPSTSPTRGPTASPVIPTPEPSKAPSKTPTSRPSASPQQLVCPTTTNKSTCEGELGCTLYNFRGTKCCDKSGLDLTSCP